tara:strand:+ start:337 stop:630 length:294 start_codon:yes stop_codon:yes gene_type:complete
MNKNKLKVEKIINNKTVHLEIPGSIHRKLRAMLFLKEISMQEFFRLSAEMVVLGDQYMIKQIEKRVDDIKNKKLSKIRNIEEKDLYDVIEQNSPFKK